MGPTKSIFELNFPIYYTYLCTKFGINRIEIATSSVDTYIQTHKHTHTENLYSCEFGGEIRLSCLWDFSLRNYTQKLVYQNMSRSGMYENLQVTFKNISKKHIIHFRDTHKFLFSFSYLTFP